MTVDNEIPASNVGISYVRLEDRIEQHLNPQIRARSPHTIYSQYIDGEKGAKGQCNFVTLANWGKGGYFDIEQHKTVIFITETMFMIFFGFLNCSKESWHKNK